VTNNDDDHHHASEFSENSIYKSVSDLNRAINDTPHDENEGECESDV